MRKKKHIQDDRLLKQLTRQERRMQQRYRNQIAAEMLASKSTLLYY